MHVKTDYQNVLEVFESEIREKYPLPPDLIERWFKSAVALYSLDIAPISYDPVTQVISGKKSPGMEYTLGLMATREYLKRELSRINKLQNVITRDVSLNATGASKTATKAEYDTIFAEIEELLHKQKVHAYN